MYAITFFTLIEESLKWDGYYFSIKAQISALPYMKKEDAKDILQTFRNMAQQNEAPTTSVQEDRKRLRQILLGRRVLK